MNKKEFIDNLKEILDTKDNINIKTKLEDYHYDSLSVIAIIAIKEQHFKKLKIDLDKISKCKIVNELLVLFKLD